MKRRIITFIALLILAASAVTLAQNSDEQRLVVPLTNPGQPVSLDVSLMAGRIEVTGYQGDEVIVVARARPVDTDEKKVDGMRRIPNTSIGLTVEEKDNEVHVGAGWISRSVDLEIQVPARSSGEISTVNGGDIVVQGLHGELELQNTNGAITATDMRGSVVANTTNGSVRVSFIEIDADKDMAFNSFNGDVDVTFPASLRADLRISAGRGEILTDFDTEQQPVSPQIERNGSGGGYRVELTNDVHLKIGGGGPTFRMKTFNGNIYIRKAAR
jgi:hypothetical protein